MLKLLKINNKLFISYILIWKYIFIIYYRMYKGGGTAGGGKKGSNLEFIK